MSLMLHCSCSSNFDLPLLQHCHLYNKRNPLEGSRSSQRFTIFLSLTVSPLPPPPPSLLSPLYSSPSPFPSPSTSPFRSTSPSPSPSFYRSLSLYFTVPREDIEVHDTFSESGKRERLFIFNSYKGDICKNHNLKSLKIRRDQITFVNFERNFSKMLSKKIISSIIIGERINHPLK